MPFAAFTAEGQLIPLLGVMAGEGLADVRPNRRQIMLIDVAQRGPRLPVLIA